MLASTSMFIPQNERVNVGCIMYFVLTESFGLILYEILLWNWCTKFWNVIDFWKYVIWSYRYNMSEFACKKNKLKIKTFLDFYQNRIHPWWRITFRNGNRVQGFILCQNYICSRWFCNPSRLIWGSVLLHLRSYKGGCCSISNDLSCSLLKQQVTTCLLW